MNQHTPGPWMVDDEIFVIGPDKLSIFGGASTKRSEEVLKANARLIAKAPEMYSLLSEFAGVSGRTLEVLHSEACALLREIDGL